jgi:hypothetical protein
MRRVACSSRQNSAAALLLTPSRSRVEREGEGAQSTAAQAQTSAQKRHVTARRSLLLEHIIQLGTASSAWMGGERKQNKQNLQASSRSCLLCTRRSPARQRSTSTQSCCCISCQEGIGGRRCATSLRLRQV